MARGQKTAVSQYERRRWLEELEKGKGITEITRETKRDIRVVKRHIKIAELERETTQVRRDFLLGRLEQHQADLLAQVERLRKELHNASLAPLEPQDPLERKYHAALQEHLQGTPLGKSLAAYSGLLQEYRNLLGQITQDLAAHESRLNSKLPPQVSSDWTGRIIPVLEMGLLPEQPYDPGEKTARYYQPRWGSLDLTRSPISQTEMKSILQAHRLLVSRAEGFSAIIMEQRRQISEAIPQIADGLDNLIVKRFISGHCQYCPL